MLQKLHIRNYAIIEELEIDFSGRLNVITGETGAGKSIIIGALGLILGERADSSVLMDRDKKCFVEGVFEVSDRQKVKSILQDNDLESNDELIIRREIGTNGKSRAFVNDTPVNLSQLNDVSSLLVDLHQQFDTLRLKDKDFQREVLDALAGHSELLDDYRELFKFWQLAQKQQANLREQKQQFEKEFDYNQFQFNELEELSLKEDELEDLEEQFKLLNNSEGIKAVLLATYIELMETDRPIVQRLKALINQLHSHSSHHKDLTALARRIESAQIELKDIANEAQHIAGDINYDAKKFAQVSERLSAGYRLLKKHGVKATNELLQIHRQLQEKLKAVSKIDDEILRKEKEVAGTYQRALRLAIDISNGRKKQISQFESKVNSLLGQVGMPNARLQVHIETNDQQLDSDGIDTINFFFDANRSGQFRPIEKTASGGELGRLMLCIKSLVAQSVDLPTLIFDEVDTGISGEAARQVGTIMKTLASKRQVISITHQAQIAGKADAHYLVYKEIVNNTVKTAIRLLAKEERITTIAKMLSGDKPTAAAMENAREIVAN